MINKIGENEENEAGMQQRGSYLWPQIPSDHILLHIVGRL